MCFFVGALALFVLVRVLLFVLRVYLYLVLFLYLFLFLFLFYIIFQFLVGCLLPSYTRLRCFYALVREFALLDC